jgi:hypothetical protein
MLIGLIADAGQQSSYYLGIASICQKAGESLA